MHFVDSVNCFVYAFLKWMVVTSDDKAEEKLGLMASKFLLSDLYCQQLESTPKAFCNHEVRT